MHRDTPGWGWDYYLDTLGAWDFAVQDPRGQLGPKEAPRPSGGVLQESATTPLRDRKVATAKGGSRVHTCIEARRRAYTHMRTSTHAVSHAGTTEIPEAEHPCCTRITDGQVIQKVKTLADLKQKEATRKVSEKLQYEQATLSARLVRPR